MTREEAEKDFNKAVNCLALELPEAVWNDVHFRWVKLQNTIRETNIEKDKKIEHYENLSIEQKQEIGRLKFLLRKEVEQTGGIWKNYSEINNL